MALNIRDGAQRGWLADDPANRGCAIKKGIPWKTNHSLAGVNGLAGLPGWGWALPLVVASLAWGGVVAQEAESSAPRIPPLESADGVNITKTLAHHPMLADRWLTFARYVLGESTLPPRERELLILRIGYLCGIGIRMGAAHTHRSRRRAQR